MSREKMLRRLERLEVRQDKRLEPLIIMLSPIIDMDGSEIYADAYACDGLPGMTVTRHPGESDAALMDRAEAEFAQANQGKNLSLVIRPADGFASP